MSVLKTDTNKILKTSSNKIRVGVKKISEIVDPSKIVSWFNASDINLPIGSYVNSITGREGKDSATVTNTNTFTLQVDEQGYKYLSVFSTNRFNTTTSVAPNNNETLILVLNNKSVSNYVFGYVNGVVNGFVQISAFNLSYSNFTVGSGRLAVSSPATGGPFNRKIVVTGVMTGTAMYLYDGLVLIGTLNNPVLSSAGATTGSVFYPQVNTLAEEVCYYSIVRIQEALSGEKLKQTIRSVAFENGVKI